MDLFPRPSALLSRWCGTPFGVVDPDTRDTYEIEQD